MIIKVHVCGIEERLLHQSKSGLIVWADYIIAAVSAEFNNIHQKFVCSACDNSRGSNWSQECDDLTKKKKKKNTNRNIRLMIIMASSCIMQYLHVHVHMCYSCVAVVVNGQVLAKRRCSWDHAYAHVMHLWVMHVAIFGHG